MITVLGVAAGRVPPGTEDVLAGARVVAGGAAVLRALAPPAARQVVLGAGVDATLAALVAEDADAVVLASGDPGFFGIVRALRRRVAPERLAVHPAPSSVALAFARLGVPWDDARVVSAHARDPRPALATALRHPKVAILTDGDATPAWFAERLAGSDRTLAVCSRLGQDGEAVVTGAAGEIAARRDWEQPNVLVSLGAPAGEVAPDDSAGWALPEAAFDHRSGMITKREVRAVALAALGPATGRLVWDVGCGSGSVAVECARLGAAAFAVDHDLDALARTQANAARFGVPVGVVAGRAPEALAALPDPDAVFAGGGGDDLEAILDACAARPTARTLVVTLALVERVGPVLARLAALGFAAEATQLQASRLAPLAGGHRLAATNPITIAVGAAVIAVGVGASRGCPEPELEDLVAAALAEAGVARVDVLASADVKADEAAIVALAERRAWPFVTFPAAALAAVPVPTPSAVVAAHVGTPSVAEAAALLAAGPGSELLVFKRRSAHATCAVATTEDAWPVA